MQHELYLLLIINAMTPSIPEAIDRILIECANDIDEYLANASTPLECYQHDIGEKLLLVRNRIHRLLFQHPPSAVINLGCVGESTGKSLHPKIKYETTN